MRRAPVVLALLALLSVLPSCSVLGLDDFPVVQCDDGVDCEPLNARDGIAADACARWVCDPPAHTCFFGTRDDDGDLQSPPSCGGADCDDADARRGSPHAEECDGIDNDCNLAIDDLDATQPGSATLVRSLDVIATIPSARGARYGASGGAHAALTLAAVSTGGTTAPAERAALVLLDGASSATSSEIEHEQPATTMFTEDRHVPGCPDAVETDGMCNEGDAAIAGNGTQWIAATVGIARCGRTGELRIAPLVSSTLRHQGPTERSHIWLGVGTGAMPGCTTNPDGSLGARTPVLSSLGGRELLAAYVADAPGEACDDEDEVEVEALGLWLGESAELSWVEATGNGVPTPMGTTRSLGGPSIAAWPGHGWLMAFGDAAGGIALRFTRPLPAPPPSPVAGVVEDTAPLVRIDLPTIGTEDVERVAIALGPVDGDTAELGIAFQEGCEARVWFVRVAVDLDTMTASAISAPIDLGVAREPAIAWVDRGVYVDAARPGGFVVLFLAAQVDAPLELRAARIADATGALVGERFAIGEGTLSPHVYEGDGPGQLRFAYENGDDLLGGSLFCSPAIE